MSPATWAEVCLSLPTGRRRGLSGRAVRWRTSPPVSRLQALSAGQGRRRRQPRRRTRARGTSRHPRPSGADLPRTCGLDSHVARQSRATCRARGSPPQVGVRPLPRRDVGTPHCCLSACCQCCRRVPVPCYPRSSPHTLPSCSEINRRGCAREPSERCDAQHHIPPGFSVLHPRVRISESERRITALVCGFTPRSYSRCYKRKCKKNIVEPSSRNEVKLIRSSHLTSWRS